MVTLLYSRDRQPKPDSGITENSGNFFDFIFHQSHAKDVACEKYTERKNRALYRLVVKAMNENLTEKQRQIFTMKAVDGKKQKEIADRLNINPSTVHRAIKSSLKKLTPVYDYYLCLNDLFVEE